MLKIIYRSKEYTMKRLFLLTIFVGALFVAACGPRTSDPAELITLNKQRELQLLGSWQLVQLKNGNAPQPNEQRTLTFQNDGQMQMDLWEHRLTFKFEVMPDPEHLRLTWVSSTNPNDKPTDVMVQPFAIAGETLTLDGDQFRRTAYANGATLTPAATQGAPTQRAATNTPPATATSNPTTLVKAHLNEPFDLHGGQSAELIDAPSQLGITFARLVSDFRCTPDVECYWAGEVRLQITFREDGIEHPPLFELTSNQNDPHHKARLTARENYVVELLEIQPPRKTTDPMPLQDYIATFRVTNPPDENATPISTPAALPTVAAATPNNSLVGKLDEPIVLKMFQTVTVPEAQMQVTLNALLEESRCPRNVNCVQAGRAVVAFTVERGERIGFFALSTMPPDARVRGYFQGYAIELQDVQPYPQNVGEKIPPREYSAKIVVRKREPPTVVHKNEPIVLHVGQSAQLADENVTVNFVRVRQDSRCPYRATCASRGDGIVEATLTQADGTTQTYVLHSDSSQNNQRTPDTGPNGMELLALNPYPRADFASKEIAPEEYEATFVVRKYASPNVVTPTPSALAPSVCLGMTRRDAEAILGQPVLSDSPQNVLVNVLPFDEIKRASVNGVCGYASVEKTSNAALPAREPRVVAPQSAAYAVTAGVLTGTRQMELTRLADILRSAFPDDDGTLYYLMQTRLAAGDTEGAVRDLAEHEQAADKIHRAQIDGLGKRAVWFWRPAQAGNYAALVIQTQGGFDLIEAFTPTTITEAAAKESLLTLAAKLVK